MVLRPNLVLVLLTLLAVAALMVSIHNEFALGSTFRAARLIGFVAVLWLLTPWWGRRDMLLLRCSPRCLWVVLATVVVGAAVAPGWPSPSRAGCRARCGRSRRPRWRTTPPSSFGTTVVLWMCRVITWSTRSSPWS